MMPHSEIASMLPLQGKMNMVSKSLQEFEPSSSDIPEEQQVSDYQMRFTRDKELISEYKKLREKLYGIDPRFVGFRKFGDTAAENYEDIDDQMLIIYDDNRVYGGTCLRISTPKHPVILDLEQDILPPPGKFYFSLREHFSELQLDRYAYMEYNRIVLDPVLRKGEAARQMLQTVLERGIKHKVRFMFGISDGVRTRLYRQIYQSLGLIGRHPDIDIPFRPEYEGIKMYMLYGDMKPFYVSEADPAADCLLNPTNDFEFY